MYVHCSKNKEVDTVSKYGNYDIDMGNVFYIKNLVLCYHLNHIIQMIFQN